MLNFFLNSQDYCMSQIILDNCKILETRPQSSKNFQKLKKKIVDLWPNLAFKKIYILRLHFPYNFVPFFFNVYFAKLKDGHIKAIENEHQCKISF